MIRIKSYTKRYSVAPAKKYANSSNSKLLILELIRVIAISFVVVFHIGVAFENHLELTLNSIFYFIPKSTELFHAILSLLGTIGVSLFLIISGFGLKYSELKKASFVDRRTWYVKRLVRIYPAYWIVLISQLFADYFFNKGVYSIWLYIMSLFCLHPVIDRYFFWLNGSFWYIFLIVQFYIVFPYLNLILNRIGNVKYLLFIGCISFFCTVIVTTEYFSSLYKHGGAFFFVRLLEFGFGMIFVHSGMYTIDKKNAFLLFFIAAVLSSVINYFFIPEGAGYGVIGIFLFLSFYNIHLPTNRFFLKILSFFSSISYGIFLVNWPVINFVKKLGLPTFIYIFFIIVLGVICLGWGVEYFATKIKIIIFTD